MSQRFLRCRNRACPVPHGAVLGRLTEDEGLVLDSHVHTFRARLGSGRVVVDCPACGTEREFRGTALYGR